MQSRAALNGLIIACLVAGAPDALAQTAARAQLNDHILPIAAGALIGAATCFFVIPLLVPGVAVATAAGASTTASPLFAAVGAGIGGLVGYELAN